MEYIFRRSYRGPLKAVILDWAGTTIDFGCLAPAGAFVDLFKRNGVDISVEEAREPMGAHKKDHIRQIVQNQSVANRWFKAHGRKPTESEVEAMFKEFIPLQMACLAQYADLIPGALQAVAAFRKRGLKIGTTTGYSEEMMTLLQAEAKKRGYEPDSTVAATQVPTARPHPYMCLQNAINLEVYPMEAMVKVGDTLTDIEEGLNAGTWSIGLAETGNELGLSLQELEKLEPSTRQAKLERAYKRMYQSGAHYVVNGIADVPPLLDEIEARLARGERP
jgi:phosphonoacetaldehyde hydrolase